ncbi:hypothetical protein L1D14_04070 [Vibrio tubiashii]|uniref:hypothetical protein n=1 Tax=Vibrio tubiashii TaxID=29498 RepID=UPI001EFE87AD|nr:hypothetical protein [Vibrio tubiashii]MCG9575407.1 hypothetical protein [Vibrio tubiashii]
MKSIAFKNGRKAAQMGIALENSALVNLRPESERYEQFIAGYDSYVKTPENQDSIDCACVELGSQCDVCDGED